MLQGERERVKWGRQVNSDSKIEFAILNLRIDGMSRHGKVDAKGLTRSINAVCTCVGSFNIKILEKRQLNVWIKEVSFSSWPEKFGVLEKGQEARVDVPPEVFAQAWEAVLTDDVATKQLNLTLRVDDDEPDYLPVTAVALDELSPPQKTELRSGSAKLADAVNWIFWALAAVYATYAVANYFKAI